MDFLQFCTCSTRQAQLEFLVNPQSTISCEGLCGKSFPATIIIACLDCLANQHGLFWYCEECRERKLQYEIHELPNSPEREEFESDLELKVSSRKVARVEEVELLPAELWTEIFRNLEAKQLLAVRQVCRRWRNVVDSSPALTAKFLLRFPAYFIVDRDYAPENLLPASAAFFDQVQFATVGPWWSSLGQGLVKINMLRCIILLPNLLKVLKQTPNLKELILADLMIDTLDDNPVTVDFRLEKLEILAVEELIHPNHMHVLLDLCPNVKELALLCEHGDEEYEHLLRKLLKYLKAVRNTLHTFEATVTDHFLEQFSALKLPKLRCLYLHDCSGNMFNDRALVEFCRKHPALQELHIGDVSWSNEMVLPEIETLLPNLRRIKLKVPDPPGIQPTLEFATELRYLHLSGSTHLVPTFVSECPHLEELVLEHLNFGEPHSLSRFLTQSQRIRELHVENCQIGYWSTIMRAIRTQKHLQRLILRELTIFEVDCCCIDYLDDLTELMLEGVSELYQQTLVALFTACSRLKRLTMVRLKKGVDRVVLEAMSEKLRMLRQLKIENCALSKADRKFARKRFDFVEELNISESE